MLRIIGISYSIENSMPLMILPFMHNRDIKSFLESKRGDVPEATVFPEVRNTVCIVHLVVILI